jgi:hypothetical protein
LQKVVVSQHHLHLPLCFSALDSELAVLVRVQHVASIGDVIYALASINDFSFGVQNEVAPAALCSNWPEEEFCYKDGRVGGVKHRRYAME